MNMAFPPNMPRVIVNLLLLILSPPFIHQVQNLDTTDYKLIQALCHNSETPETCMRCVKSAKGSEKADTVGIAIILVNCINNQAETLAANMTKLASEMSDQKLKELCQSCAYLYSGAKKKLTTAKQALQNHKYDNAEYFVMKALTFDATCQGYIRFNFNHSEVPSDVVFNMKIYEELSEAACRIIEKIYV